MQRESSGVAASLQGWLLQLGTWSLGYGVRGLAAATALTTTTTPPLAAAAAAGAAATPLRITMRNWPCYKAAAPRKPLQENGSMQLNLSQAPWKEVTVGHVEGDALRPPCLQWIHVARVEFCF